MVAAMTLSRQLSWCGHGSSHGCGLCCGCGCFKEEALGRLNMLTRTYN
jgi:hypothetical protein